MEVTLPMGNFRPTLRVGTPDPNGYHRPDQVTMEGASVAGRSMSMLLPGGRGTIIPQATRAGGSRGIDHNAPQRVHVDPHIGGGVVVDLADVTPEAVERAVEESSAYADFAEGAFAAYARLSDPEAVHHPDNVLVLEQPQESAYRQGRAGPPPSAQGTIYDQALRQGRQPAAQRQAPLQMAGSYVVPQSTPGGAQFLPEPVEQYAPAPPPPPVRQELRPRHPTRQQPPPQEELAPASFAEPVTYRKIREPLRAAFEEQPSMPAPQQVPMRQVTFELPGGGQFEVVYHQIVLEKNNLILVLDHRHFMQMKYFPPSVEEPIAVLLHQHGNQPEHLLLCHTTGIRFRHEHYEYCVLLVEEEKDMQGQPVET